ncbi:MAG: DNA mismatch repair protein MutT [Spirochaetae bacterium HGW-Spirochaetae-1]|jgi:8-oxo-dGTP pyrophosphatase MutT (NUDIX family)|nr:MAG: DNA mismatch repair protein MutT [Spirochaetae bacterium HGW-Spirochaetae-1]
MEQFYPGKIMKFCPRCGSDRFTLEEDMSFLCGQCALHYYINASAAVTAIIENEKDEILFTRRSQEPARGMLDLPGGFVDVLESAEDALKREINEELNLEISELRYIKSFPNRYLFNDLVYFTLDLVYRCSIKDMSGIRAADDVSGFSFIHPGYINIDEIGLESVKNIINYFNELKNANT